MDIKNWRIDIEGYVYGFDILDIEELLGIPSDTQFIGYDFDDYPYLILSVEFNREGKWLVCTSPKIVSFDLDIFAYYSEKDGPEDHSKEVRENGDYYKIWDKGPNPKWSAVFGREIKGRSLGECLPKHIDFCIKDKLLICT